MPATNPSTSLDNCSDCRETSPEDMRTWLAAAPVSWIERLTLPIEVVTACVPILNDRLTMAGFRPEPLVFLAGLGANAGRPGQVMPSGGDPYGLDFRTRRV